MEDLLSQLTLEEKAALVAGTDFMYTNPVSRLSIPSLRFSDGPHGLRVQQEGGDNGVTGSSPATSFPTAVALASSWNPENSYRLGQAMGEEAKDYGIHMILGPGVNIKRNPLCGRNFEYFSEDPFLASEMGAAEINGIQSQGVGSCVKHFALNSSENIRFYGNAVCDDRAMREIYLKVFERVVKKSNPAAVMCAYNQINGTFCSENHFLLTEVLREDWGYKGLVMTDWGAIRDRVLAIKAGLDLEMPGDTAYCRKAIVDAVNNGTLSMKELDACVSRVLALVGDLYFSETKPADYKSHHDLAGQLAQDSAVLLKNDGLLPLEEGKPILVLGDLFEKMRYQGAGSSMINPAYLVSPKQAFDEHQVSYQFARGYEENKGEPNQPLIEEAVEKAQNADTILLFLGLTDTYESEGGDRDSLSLPENQLALVSALLPLGKKIAVVLFGGSVVELPFAENVNSILNMFLPGQNGGIAAYNLLFGHACPNGRLSETWVKSYQDIPFGEFFGKHAVDAYRESVFVGYRYSLTAKKEVAYPFGYGLSYTTFEYLEPSMAENGNSVVVSLKVKNTGERAGAEVIQAYVKGPSSSLAKPERELRGFAKVYLEPGETKSVQIAIPKEDLAYWNRIKKRWSLEKGEYLFLLGRNAQDIFASFPLFLEGEESEERDPEYLKKADFSSYNEEDYQAILGFSVPSDPPKRPITIETPFGEFAHSSFLGKILYKALTGVATKQRKEAEKLPEGPEKDNKIKGAEFLLRIFNTNSCRSLSMSGGAAFPYNLAEGFVSFANGKLFQGIKHFASPYKAPKLPKEK